MPSSLGKERKRSSRVVILAVVLVAILIVGAVAWLTFQSGNNREPHPTEYNMHNPISINGNEGFTNASGVVGGSGTESDPYIIADWNISASTATGISIEDTDAHFIVRNCYVHDGGSPSPADGYTGYDGIGLSGCVNGTLENNNCSNDLSGIYLTSSSNNTLTNNTCSNYVVGIYLWSSHDNTLSDNNCSWNGVGINLHSSNNNALSNNNCSNNQNGIELFSSSNNNTLSNNTCSSNGYGIDLDTSSNDTLRNNVMINDGMVIGGGNVSRWNTHDIGTSNTVNGKPVFYYKDQSGITVPAGAGQVILANCTDFIIENQNLSDATTGIEIGFCSHGILSNNTCDSNGNHGIDLESSSNCTLSNNSCSNDGWGIGLYWSSNNTLSSNNCSSCGGGMHFLSSHDNTLTNNNCSSNGNDGIDLDASNNNTLINNNWKSNVNYGVYLDISSNNTLTSNNCSRNQYGIRLGSIASNDNEISHNLVCNNAAFGAYIEFGYYSTDSSSNNRIWNNTFIGNNGATSTYNASHTQAYGYGAVNWWNNTDGHGNFWNDWTTPDANHDGIVDLPYDIAGSGADFYPRTTP